MLRVLLALALIAFPLWVAAPASADESACAGTYYDQEGFDLFTPEARYVPPPLRLVPWDCAARATNRPFGFDTGVAVEYTLVYTNVDFDVLVRMVRAFEQQGWLDGTFGITSIDTGDGIRNSTGVTADELAALDSPPLFAGGRFGNAATHQDIISLSYADGVEYTTNGNAFTTPNLVVSVSVDEPFPDTGAADPSVFSGLKSIGDVHITAAGAAVLGSSAIMLTLVIGYPGSLLNAVIGQYYVRLRDSLRKRLAPKKRTVGEAPAKRSRLVGWLFLPGLVLAALISGFVDPAFGANAMSLRVLVTAFLSLLVFNLVGWSLVRGIMRKRRADASSEITFRWGSLILVVIAVVIARLLDFHPGVVFGLVAGLAFTIALPKGAEALVVVLGAGFGLAIALVSWGAFTLLAPLAAGAPGNLPLVFASEFFSALTIEGIASLPLVLLPLLALDGHKLFTYRKWLWAVCYAVGLLAFMLVLLTIPSAWGQIGGDFVRWLLLFGAFGVVAVAVWVVHLVLVRRAAAATTAPSDGQH